MPEYLSPGVYVEEVSSGIKPIEGVGTSTGAFVGRALKGPRNQPVLITNFTQFNTVFGGFRDDFFLAYAVRNFFFEGGTRCYVVRVFNLTAPPDPANPTPDRAGVILQGGGADVLRVLALNEGLWGNNISVVVGPPIATPNLPADPEQRFSLTVLYRETASALPEIVETFDGLSMREFTADGLPNPIHVEAQINGLSKYVEVEDVEAPNQMTPPDNTAAGTTVPLVGGGAGAAVTAANLIGGVATQTTPATGLFAFDQVDDINIVAIPDLVAPPTSATDARNATLQAINYCELRKDCFYVADSPPNQSPQSVLAYKQGTTPAGNAFNSSYAALYYPWIRTADPLTGKTRLFPPSGSTAGIYSSTDVLRGVHKAPAGTEVGRVKTATDIERVITKGEHDTLNPRGVNVIRKFPEAGIVVWGARTISADPELKYLNVRRLLLFLEESIDEGTQWAVFEPNDPVLWARIVRNVSAFLRIQWQEGKLVGLKETDAFFVKCDEETNPPESVDLGRVITLIGVAPSKPAEFVIFRIMQKRPGADV
jgi:phage tail sheath protein FI